MSPDNRSRVLDVFRGVVDEFELPVKPTTTIRILVVVERMFSLRTGPGRFGIGSVIEHIRNTDTGDYRFEVDIAMRPGSREERPETNPDPAPHEPKYTGFRFDQMAPPSMMVPLINKYDEIWCFGWNPGNNANPTDDDIDNAEFFPATDSELKILTLWMIETRRGGLFATGDHHYLGASLCSRIPRVGTMRKWTHAQGVPPIAGLARVVTNRQLANSQTIIDPIPQFAEEDSIPQPISCVMWGIGPVGVENPFLHPHPVLSHPLHGPIDVMPDHIHEGMCFDQTQIKLDGTYNFSGFAGHEYPTVNGFKPTPTVIAYGTTLPDPPYVHEGGDSSEKRIPMISVYDGHTINIGRVAVDSTWHHWLDMNIWSIKNAADKTNWEKISQYYVNLAVWLIPPEISRNVMTWVMFRTQFEYFGLEVMSPQMSIFQIGSAFRDYWKTVGPSWITQFVLNWISVADPALYKRVVKEQVERKPKTGFDPLNLMGPSFRVLENAVLGGMALQAYELTEPIKRGTDRAKATRKIDKAEFEKQLIAGVNRGLGVFRETLNSSFKIASQTFLTK